MINIDVRHEEPSNQRPSILTIPVMVIPEASTTIATTIPPPIPPFIPLPQLSTPTPTPTTEATTSLLVIPDFSSLFGFNQRVSVLEKELSQLKQVNHSTQLLEAIKSQVPAVVEAHLGIKLGDSIQKVFQSYTAEFEKKAQAEKKRYINLIEKSVKDIINDEKGQSYQGVKEHKELYDGLVKSYKLDKDLFESYGKAYSLKRDREDKDKDEDPPAGSSQGLKRRKTSKDAEPSKGLKSKESKSSSSKVPKSQPKSFGKSTQAEESLFEAADTEMPKNQGSDLGNTDDQPNAEATSKHNNLEGKEYPFDLSKPLPLIMDQVRQVVSIDYFINNDLEYLKGGSSSKKHTTSTTKTKATKYDIPVIEDMVPSLWIPVKVSYDRYAVISYWKLHNLEKDVIFDLGVALWMFTKRIIILKRVEDLQLGFKSYQKKLNVTKPETFRSDISKIIPYTTYNNPQGIIYKDKYKRNRLMRTDELYKLSDGTLTSVRTVLHDIASNLRMDYLPKKI
ncbi:hypothetical protein Tco_0356477 [Tanacetum coccineum]